MLKKQIPVLLGLLTCAFVPQPALADEVWTTEEYDVIYQADRNSTAIWSYGNSGLVFIDGLGGVYTDRGSYSGYWVQETSSLRCDTYREGAEGKPTYHWGRFEVTFIDPDFPSRWHAHIGLCDREPTIPLNGTPVLGGTPEDPGEGG
ncbi:MAG: hypothetical protein F6J97_26615 [Leptolyngbya sp. SIO4C1]|nr:hypothetical protein [Leptolyngbya sp. SIO4C1]